MEDKVLSILKEVFEINDIDTTCSQSNCEQWDSMNQLNLVLALEEAFDISLEPEEIGEMKSFQDIMKLLNEKL